MVFLCLFLFVVLDHNTLADMIAFHFDLAAPTWQTAVLFLTSKTSVNRWSGFLAMHYLTVMGGPGDIGMLSVNPSVVETIYS